MQIRSRRWPSGDAHNGVSRVLDLGIIYVLNADLLRLVVNNAFIPISSMGYRQARFPLGGRPNRVGEGWGARRRVQPAWGQVR